MLYFLKKNKYQIKVKSFAILALGIGLFVFGGNSKENTLNAQGHAAGKPDSMHSPKPLIFIYLQGYNSCRKIVPKPVKIFKQKAAGNPNAKLYWGCFDGGHLTHLHDTRQYFYLYSMDTNGHWSAGEEVDAQSGSLKIAHYIHRDLKEFARNLGQKKLAKADVFIAGHSHGGWMAMKTAYQMAFIQQVQVRQLLTIDPISYKLCPSQWFPAHLIYSTFNWLGEPGDCHRAPADLDHLIPTIKEVTGDHWTNIYQESMPYLTSGPIEEANKNIRYEPPTTTDWMLAHRAITRTDWTWSFLVNRLTEVRAP
jgi:hypothetical protein